MRRIALIGMGPTARDAPRAGDGWELWGMPWDPMMPLFDRLFEMHDRALAEKVNGPGYVEELRNVHCALVMQREWDDIPSSEAYPFAAVERDVFAGVRPDQRYGSSIAYMLALAIHERPGEIGLWGVDLLGEYDHQRSNIAFLVGMAMGRGIPVQHPPTVLRFEFPPEHVGPVASRYGFVE